MKKTIIGTFLGLGLIAGLVIGAINEDRRIQEISREDGVQVVRKETFKEAAKRKVNDILKWFAENPEKVDGFVKVATTTATVIGIATSTVEFFSSIKKINNKTDEKLLQEVDEIRLRLLYLTPDVEVNNF